LIYTKASGVNDSIFGRSQEPIKMMLEKYEESFEAKSMIKEIFTMDKTNNFAERFVTETSLGDFRPVGEAGNYPRTTMQESYAKVIEPEEWKLSFGISQTMVEDGKIGKAIRKKGNNFMTSFHRTREKFAAEMLRNCINASFEFGERVFDIRGADGRPFFATDHPSITAATLVQSNRFNAAFTYDNLSHAEERMQKFVDDDGHLLNIQPDTIIIPNNARIKMLVFHALNAENVPGVVSDGGSYHFGRWTVKVWNYLANPAGITPGTDWWILCDSQMKDIIEALPWLDRIPLSVHSWIDHNNDNNMFNGRARFGAAPNNWRAFAACTPGAGTALT